MASPQPTDSHTRLSNELFTEILTRDFTKWQRAIIDLIIRLSYGCGRKTALIPLTKQFEICGVPANKVRKELDGLKQMSVIDWDAEQGWYWLNKDYDAWGIPGLSENVRQKFNELLKANIQAPSHDRNGHDQNSHDDQNVQQNMPETVISSGPKRSSDLAEIPGVATSEAMPITKNITKDKKNSTETTPTLNQEQEQALKTLHSFLKPRSDDAEWILEITRQYPKVDLAKTAWNLKMWLQERPEELKKKKANHRSRFRNFVKWDNEKKIWRKAHSHTHTPSNDESDYEKRIMEALV